MEETPPIRQAITCSPDNIAEFNARLRAELPEFAAFAKAMLDAGLIDGLRGARIGPVGSLPADGVPMTPLSLETERSVADSDWKRGRVQP